MKSMNDRYFIDSNILVYANDRSSPDKQRRAKAIIKDALTSRAACLSTQVLQEFFVVATRKASLPPSNARAQILVFSDLDTVIIDAQLVISAIDCHIIHHISFWDALIIKSAAAAGCQRLLTENLNHGQVIDGVKIENPFLH
jgi:predicted nucleic acid-binding protein